MEDFFQQKNHSSVRKAQIDRQTVIQFSELIKMLPKYEPIFVENKIYNLTINDLLERRVMLFIFQLSQFMILDIPMPLYCSLPEYQSQVLPAGLDMLA